MGHPTTPHAFTTATNAAARQRHLRYWVMAMMLTIGLHLAGLGACAQTFWMTSVVVETALNDDAWVMTIPQDEAESPELLPHVVITPPKPHVVRRLAKKLRDGGPSGNAIASHAPVSRRLLPMEPIHVSTTEISVVPRHVSTIASLTPRQGMAPLPGGAGGERVTAEATTGEAVGECVVFLYDNSLTGKDGQRLHDTLIERLHKLDPLQYFYVVAFDQSARRMFSKHSPELRPLPPTRYNIRLVSRWLNTLTNENNTTGAEWAVVHALQLHPASIEVLSGGGWPRAASAYLRSTNQGPNRRVRVPVHVLVTRHAHGEPNVLNKMARDNAGTFEVLSSPASLAIRRQ